MTISPYKITGPTTEDMFFGRERELREIIDRAKSTSFAIIGGRRVGKSSFLLRLHLNSLPRNGFRTVYHDCTTTPTYKDFLAARLSKWQPKPGLWKKLPATFGELLQSPPTDKPLVLLLDEVDKLIPTDRVDHWRLFNTLRSSVSQRRLQVVLCGESRLLDALKEDSYPLFNFLNERRLGPLDYPDVEKLVIQSMQRMGIALEEEEIIVKRIWNFTSGHPNVVQRLCHRLIMQLNVRKYHCIRLTDVIEVTNNPEFQEEDFLETYLAQATPLERIIALLMALGKEDKPSSLQDITNLLAQIDLTPSIESTKEALVQLTDLRSILKRNEVGFAFAVEAFPQVLRERVSINTMLIALKEEYERALEDENSISAESDTLPILARRKQFDVFLSYSSKDKTWVNRLKETLQNQGVKVWLDHDQIRPGDLFAGVLERGLEESKTMALIVSPESMESGWVEEEYRRALSLAKRKLQPLQLIPVILRDAELPGFLEDRQRVDFREESLFAQSLEQLIWGITGKRPTTSAAQKEEKHYQAGFPLSGETSVYIERKADREAFTHLRNMDYISFLEPRLQGKTSLIYRLMQQLSSSEYAFVICDLASERFSKKSEPEWYRSLGKWVLNNLDFLPEETQPSLPNNSTEWQTFLESIAKAAREAKRKVVIILDELGAMPSAYATPFFTVIRSIYIERAITPSHENLTFITSGAFNPKELIQDEGVSKFNVDRRIKLQDFTLAQVRKLVDHLQLSEDVADMVAKRVYFWTDGQPYLTQKLCIQLARIAEFELIQSPQVTRAVDRLARQLFGDSQYLVRIRRLAEREPRLFRYVQSILHSRNKPKFNQALNDDHFRLASIYGVIKADNDGRCRISNRIIEQALKEIAPVSVKDETSLIETNWQEWTSEITRVLKDRGRVARNDLPQVPYYLWTRVLTKYKEESTGLSVIISQGELRLERGLQWLARWNQAWSAATEMLSRKGTIEQLGPLTALTNVIAEAAGLRWDNQWQLMGPIYATTVNAHALRLNIPRSFPIIFVPSTAISPDIVSVLVGLCSLMNLRQYFALVFVLESEENSSSIKRLHEILQNSSDVDDFIVLSRDNLIHIFSAPNPVSQLVQRIVSDISPAAVSPFGIREYVTGPMFFGRDREIREIIHGLSARSFAIVGNRRIGKTSLLHKVIDNLEQSQVYSLTLLNLQGTFDLAGLYRYLDDELDFKTDKAEPEAFRSFVNALSSRAHNRKVLLLVDEPDALLFHDASRGYPLSWIWRELTQNGRCRFIFAGHRFLTRIMRDASSPFFNFGERLPLGFLERAEADKLLTVPLNEMGIALIDNKRILDQVWEVSAGHPSVIQLIGRNLLKCLKRGERLIKFEHLEQVLSVGAFIDEYSATIWGDWGSGDASGLQGISPLERAILILAGSGRFTETTILDTLVRNDFHAKDEDVYGALDMLATFGLLIRHEQVYTCTIPYFIESFRHNQRIDYWLDRYKKLVNE